GPPHLYFSRVVRSLYWLAPRQSDPNQIMRLACYVFWATVCFVPTRFILAGSYPAATNLSQIFDVADGIIQLGDGSLIGSEQPAGTNPPVAGVFGSALRLAEKTTTNAIGSFKLPDLDPGNVIKSFDLRF